MEKYKIEFADARLTPEQLKAVEDKIEELEKEVSEYEFKFKRMALFFQKLNEISNLDPTTMDVIFNTDKDYYMMISNNFHSDKISFHLRQKP